MNLGKSIARLGAAVTVSGAHVLGTALSASASTTYNVPAYHFKATLIGHVYGVQIGHVGNRKICSIWDDGLGLDDGCLLHVYKTFDIRLNRISDGKVLSVTRMDLWKTGLVERTLQHEFWKHKKANRVPSVAWVKKLITTAKTDTDDQAHDADDALTDGRWYGLSY